MKSRSGKFNVFFIAAAILATALAYNNCAGAKPIFQEQPTGSGDGTGPGDSTNPPVSTSFIYVGNGYSFKKFVANDQDGALTDLGNFTLSSVFGTIQAVFDTKNGIIFTAINGDIDGYYVNASTGDFFRFDPSPTTSPLVINHLSHDPTRNLLFASMTNGSDGSQGTVTSYKFDPATKKLTAINSVPADFAAMTGLHPSGKFLYVTRRFTATSYGSQVVNVAADGTLSLGPTSPVFVGILLGYVFDPTGNFLYAFDSSGTSAINVYQISQTTGALTQVSSIPMTAPAGSYYDYRGIKISPNGRHLYTVQQHIAGPNGVLSVSQSSITKFSINQTTGALTVANSITYNGTAMGLSIDPLGKAAYVTSPDFVTNSSSTIRQFFTDPMTNALTQAPTTFDFQGGAGYYVYSVRTTTP